VILQYAGNLSIELSDTEAERFNQIKSGKWESNKMRVKGDRNPERNMLIYQLFLDGMRKVDIAQTMGLERSSITKIIQRYHDNT
jgi:DNA invertase Pin-like site-specific DNA recombinase